MLLPDISFDCDTSENIQYVYGEAFNHLIGEINDDFNQGAAFETTALLEKYKRHLNELGLTDTTNYRTEKTAESTD